MHGIQKMSQGLIIGLIVACTVLGGIVLSTQRGAARPIVQTIPTITLEVIAAAPSATPVVITPQPTAPPIGAGVSGSPSPTPTATPTVCPVPGGWQRYIVGPFDTLALIAQKFNSTVDQIASANCLATTSLSVAQAIYVPSTAPTPTPPLCNPPWYWPVYIVRPGDTLSSIAQRYRISLYTLMRANCLSSSFIYYGQPIRVPPTVPVVTFPPPPIWPTPTPTPVPTIVSTPTSVPPTGTIVPSQTPTVMPPTIPPTIPPVTGTPMITDTPAPSDTPVATDTPAPTGLPGPTDTPIPTSTSIPPTSPPTSPPPTNPPPTNPPPTSPPPTNPPATNPPPADTPIPPADSTPSALLLHLTA